jgi:hypothetical protein
MVAMSMNSLVIYNRIHDDKIFVDFFTFIDSVLELKKTRAQATAAKM